MVIPGIAPKQQLLARTASSVRRISWRDQTAERRPLADIEFIEADNKGRKVSCKDWPWPASSSSSKPPRDILVEDFLRLVLEWNPCWLKEQRKFGGSAPPRVEGE